MRCLPPNGRGSAASRRRTARHRRPRGYGSCQMTASWAATKLPRPPSKPCSRNRGWPWPASEPRPRRPARLPLARRPPWPTTVLRHFTTGWPLVAMVMLASTGGSPTGTAVPLRPTAGSSFRRPPDPGAREPSPGPCTCVSRDAWRDFDWVAGPQSFPGGSPAAKASAAGLGAVRACTWLSTGSAARMVQATYIWCTACPPLAS